MQTEAWIGSSGLAFGEPIRMRDLSSILQHAVDESIANLRALAELDQQLRRAADLIAQSLGSGHQLLLCGNGGSASDAAHIATEFVVRFTDDRRPYPAICFSSDGGLLTAAANDYGFDEIFARQVAAYARAGDVLICLTTSGNSRNVTRALEEARKRNLQTISFLGRDGGSAKGLADIELLVRGETTARIQEAHKFLLHVLCEAMESRLPRV
ncbi:MAG TPA: SIS domain-containing protein [Chthoniobacterales bacterium]|nr:SIS domain-containing protein [Chthoniobacterales bacterium]